jgi:hypothetical protein
MKKFIAFIFISMAFCGVVLAKKTLPEFEKAREIKPLQSTREDVKRILADFEHNEEKEEDYTQTFSGKKAEITVYFSRGDCSEDFQSWNVAEWVVTRITITPEDAIKVKDFKFNFSDFTKETEDEEFPEDYIYYNELYRVYPDRTRYCLRKFTAYCRESKFKRN